MTRKDFDLIAETLKAGTEYAVYRQSALARSQHALMCSEMAASLKVTNPNFDKRRFLFACGLEREAVESL